MAENPLKQYFRQPKIYITLPSKGVFNGPESLENGKFENVPIYGMTGMDEIVLKTPDALMTGESTIRMIESCCPTFKDAWQMSAIDANTLYAAIRIATYGNNMGVTQVCESCEEENDYDLDLNRVIEHYATCHYNYKLIVDNITIKTKPLTYKESSDFGLASYNLQQQLNQGDLVEDPLEKQKVFKELFEELTKVQHSLFLKSVESVEVDNQVVDNQEFIHEWLANCDKKIFDELKKHVDANREAWVMPTWPVKCTHCQAESEIYVDLDNTNFFDNA